MGLRSFGKSESAYVLYVGTQMLKENPSSLKMQVNHYF